ncbi:MAG: ABC transporter ATP-binding protein [Acidimicrobiia bacterium]
MGEPAISVQRLTKRYAAVTALNELSLDIPAGVIYGLIGPNGAGKTTLIKSIVGALRPTSGSITVIGHDPLKDRWALRQRIGYMPQENALYDDLTAAQNVRFFGAAHMRGDDLDRAVARALEFVELANRAGARVHTLSGGMRQRVSLACALVHPPDVAILDEPTAGVDPELRRAFWDGFRSLRDQGATVIVSTHQMSEVVECDHVALMRSGSLLLEATPNDLIARAATSVRVWRRDGTTDDHAVDDYRTELPPLLHADAERVELLQEPLEDVLLRLIEESR